jgi:hypothetical protein
MPHAWVNLAAYGAKVWCEYHNYLGPTFYRSENAIKIIETPSRKTWRAFEKWRKETTTPLNKEGAHVIN